MGRESVSVEYEFDCICPVRNRVPFFPHVASRLDIYVSLKPPKILNRPAARFRKRRVVAICWRAVNPVGLIRARRPTAWTNEVLLWDSQPHAVDPTRLLRQRRVVWRGRYVKLGRDGGASRQSSGFVSPTGSISQCFGTGSCLRERMRVPAMPNARIVEEAPPLPLTCFSCGTRIRIGWKTVVGRAICSWSEAPAPRLSFGLIPWWIVLHLNGPRRG